MGKSLAQEIAELPDEARLAALEGLDPDELLYEWRFWGRPEQFAPPGNWSVWLAVAGRGWGKDLASTTPIPTPDGFTAIGDLGVGDVVFAHDGTRCEVTKVQDFRSRPVYRVTFRDGSHVDASDTHEWNIFRGKTRSYYAGERDLRRQYADWWEWSYQPTNPGQKHIRVPEPILTRAKELRVDGYSWRRVERTLRAEFPNARPMETARGRVAAILEGDGVHDTRKQRYASRTSLLVETRDLRVGDVIPTTQPLDLPVADLPIDPYVFGLWLGDGITAGGEICGAPEDLQVYLDYMDDNDLYPDRRVRGMDTSCASVSSKTLTRQLRALGMATGNGVRKTPKFVPSIYLRGSIQQRIELLRGIMDTDGSVSAAGHVAGAGFVLEDLADALYDLVVGLGMVAYRKNRMLSATDRLPARLFYGVSFRPVPELNPFKLSRKSSRVTEMPRDQASRKTMRSVKSVEYVGLQPTRCIAINHRSQLFLAGRAMVPTHNTRAGAEWVREVAMSNPGCRIALVGRTSADVGKVMINGDSGLISISPPSERPEHKVSKREVVWPNGSIAETYSAEEPDQLRGPQSHFAWADEFAAWKYVKDASGLNAWDNLRIACRLGEHPQILATTTPKRTPAMQDMLIEAVNKPGQVVITRGSTYDNVGNLSQAYLDVITGVYEGTSLAQQELMGIMLEAMEGAIFSEEMIQHGRFNTKGRPSYAGNGSNLPLRVVAVDPSVAESPKDECGIVVVGATRQRQLHERHAYVLEDATVHGSPEVWVKQVVEVAKKWNCPVVAEKNQGHALIDLAIRNVDPSVKVYPVHSMVGKKLRAEPVALTYEQSRVHHLGYFAELETQMTGWVPGETKKSPDRLDALVHGITALLIAPPKGYGSGPIRASSAASRQLPGVGSRSLTRRTGRRAA